jgi:tRNA(fMet)-specific endonuclease VapC
VLDTNTLIYYFEGRGNVARNLAMVSPEEIAVSTIVLFELRVGLAKLSSPAKQTQQLQLLSRVQLVSFDRNAALAAGTIRAQLEQRGTPIGPMDVRICTKRRGTATRP